MIFKKIVKHSLIYGLIGPINAFFSIVLISVFTRYLTQKDYANLELYIVTGSFCSLFINLGIGSGIFKVILYDTENKYEKSSLLGTAFVFLLIISLCFMTITLACLVFTSKTILTNIPNNYILIIIISAIFESLCIVPLTSLRIDERSGMYLSLIILRSVFGFLISIYLLVGLRLGLFGIIFSMLCQSIFLLIVSYYVTHRAIKLSMLIKPLIEILKFSVPLVPMAIAMFVINLSDRYFLGVYSTKEELAVYALGCKVASIVLFAVSAFQMAWPPYLFSLAKLPQAKFLYKRIFTYVIISLGIFGLGLVIYSKELISILAPPSYGKATNLVPCIALSNILLGVFYASSVGTNLKKKTFLQSISVIISAIFNTILNFILIPKFGASGAAVSTLIAYFVMVIINLNFSLSLFPIKYEWKRIAKFISGCLLLGTFYLNVNITPILASIVFKLFGIISFIFILLISGFFEKDEISLVKSLKHFWGNREQ